MSELDEIRGRVDALEAEMDRVREEAATTRALAAMADRDAGEVRGALRAHTQALSALRETQVEQSRALQGLAEAVGALAVGQQQQGVTLQEIRTLLGQSRGD